MYTETLRDRFLYAETLLKEKFKIDVTLNAVTDKIASFVMSELRGYVGDVWYEGGEEYVIHDIEVSKPWDLAGKLELDYAKFNLTVILFASGKLEKRKRDRVAEAKEHYKKYSYLPHCNFKQLLWFEKRWHLAKYQLMRSDHMKLILDYTQERHL